MRSKKALKNIFVSLILQLVTIICGFIVPKMIIQSFGSKINGLISSITQFLAYITLLESGVGPVIKATLYKPISKKDNQQIANILNASEKFFKNISYIFLGYLTILCIIYPMILNQEFDFLFTVSLILIISISTFAEYYFGMTYKLYLQAEQQYYVVSEIQIFTIILNAIVVIGLIRMGASIQMVKLLSAVVFILRPILQNVYVKKKYNINLEKADNSYKLKQKWDGLAQHIASVVLNNTDIAILTFFCTLNEVSVYSVYLLIITAVKRITEAFTGGIDASFGDMIAKGEKDNLNRKFKIYETFYFTLITIIFTCTFILIVPFIKVYTIGISDENYIRPLFGFLIVLAEFMHSIRLPYSTLTLAAGHFKETKKGAWAEVVVNIVLSIVLVFKFGIIGVSIGTFVAMLVRTIEFIIHSSKFILNRNLIVALKKILIILLEVILILIINQLLFANYQVYSYASWFGYAVCIASITVVIILLINIVIFKKDYKDILQILKNIKKV